MLLDTKPNINDVEKTDPTGATTLQVITAGADSRCNTKPNSQNITPPNIPSVTAIQNHLNETWERQANVHLTVSPIVVSETVNFDLDRDGKLNRTDINRNEADAIDANRVPNAFNLYYVGMGIVPDPSDPTHITAAYSNRLLAESRYRTFLSPNGLEVNTVAHEIGHLLGASICFRRRVVTYFLMKISLNTKYYTIVVQRVGIYLRKQILGFMLLLLIEVI